MKGNLQSNCPLTGSPGHILRTRTPEQLIALYSSYLGGNVPVHILKKYLRNQVSEFYSSTGGIRWYSPTELGEGDYYEALSMTFKWYYGSESWDKEFALKRISQLRANSVVEVGCGNGALLKRLKDLKIDALGLDINEEAIVAARANGLKAHLPSQLREASESIGALVMLQTIEHVRDPRKCLARYIKLLKPTRILISAPCWESLLGHTSDPLCWPPHHATSWSELGMRNLATAVGYRVREVHYSPLDWKTFRMRLQRENGRRLFRLPRFPRRSVGRLLFGLFQAMNIPWATRGHSILGAFIRLDNNEETYTDPNSSTVCNCS